MQQPKRTRLSPLEIVASLLCLLYGVGFFLLARLLLEMGLITTIVRQTQALGIGMFLIALLGFLRLRSLSPWLHVLVGVAWLVWIPLGYTVDQGLGGKGLGFALTAAGFGGSLTLLHFFFAHHIKRKAQE